MKVKEMRSSKNQKSHIWTILNSVKIRVQPKESLPCFGLSENQWIRHHHTYWQALVLTQIVLTSSVVVSSSISSPRWRLTNLRHKDFNRPIWSQTIISFDFIVWQRGEKNAENPHKVTPLLLPAGLPPLHAFGAPYFTSAVMLFPRIFFTLFKDHLHAQHRPGSCRQYQCCIYTSLYFLTLKALQLQVRFSLNTKLNVCI